MGLCVYLGVRGGSWLLISRVISRLITHIRGLITPLIATPEPPSRNINTLERCRARVSHDA